METSESTSPFEYLRGLLLGSNSALATLMWPFGAFNCVISWAFFASSPLPLWEILTKGCVFRFDESAGFKGNGVSEEIESPGKLSHLLLDAIKNVMGVRCSLAMLLCSSPYLNSEEGIDHKLPNQADLLDPPSQLTTENVLKSAKHWPLRPLLFIRCGHWAWEPEADM
jgi:hypothetical protein